MATQQGTQSNGAPGNILVRSLKKWLMQPSRVASAEMLSEHFRIIALEGDAMKTASWIPGQQIQIALGSGLTGRTYTPMIWDRDAGATQLLIFLHGDGPGCTWARTAQSGSRYDFLGPTRELRLAFDRPFTLFGDETDFGLAIALQGAAGFGIKPRFHFEVSNAAESRDVLTSIDVSDAHLVERTGDGQHLADMARVLATSANEGHQLVLSGNARSIQQMKKRISTLCGRAPAFIVKPYWSPGKNGLS